MYQMIFRGSRLFMVTTKNCPSLKVNLHTKNRAKSIYRLKIGPIFRDGPLKSPISIHESEPRRSNNELTYISIDLGVLLSVVTLFSLPAPSLLFLWTLETHCSCS